MPPVLVASEICLADAVDYGITVTEIAAMDQPISVSIETSAAFVGRTLRGPVNVPTRVHSYTAFKRRFGGAWRRSSLPEAARQFFEHGGRELYVVRVCNGARGAMLCLPADGSALVLRAFEPGSTEQIRAAIDYDRIDDDEHFNLTLQRIDPESGHVIDQELHAAVSYIEDSTQFVGDSLANSTLARIEMPYPRHRPEPTGLDYLGEVEKGRDGSPLSDYDLVGSRSAATGVFALNDIDHFDLLYLPKGQEYPGATAMYAAELYCRERGAMLICDPLPDWESAELALQEVRKLGYASPNMLTYYPAAHCREAERVIPVGGAIAGLSCRNDRERGAWHPLDDVGLNPRFKPTVELDAAEQQKLNRAGMNSFVINARRRGAISGDRSLSRGSEAHIAFNRLSVRRTILQIVNTIDHATRWAIFEKLDERYADRLRGQLLTYLDRLLDLEAFEDAEISVDCAPMAGTGVSVDLRFTPRGMRDPVSLTLHQSVGGLKVAGTAFGRS